MKTITRTLSLVSMLIGISIYAQQSDFNTREVNFKNPDIIKEWHPLNHISSFKVGNGGLEVVVDGEDPYFVGPPMNFPSDKPLWLILKVKSEKGGMGQIFYFKKNATEEDSVRFDIRPVIWQEIEVPLPKLGTNYRFRIDPPGNSGVFVIEKFTVEPRVEFTFPQWKPEKFITSAKPVISAGKLTMHLNDKNPLAYEFQFNGKSIGCSIIPVRIGYTYEKELHWVELSPQDTTLKRGNNRVSIQSTFKDKHKGEWSINYTFQNVSNVIETTTEVSCNQRRQVMFLPLHLLSAGEKQYGTNKTQGLFAGLEYLENEASSSQLDIVGPESARRTPSPHKVTFPLMSIVQNGVYIGFIWENNLEYAPIFDSPDRTFNTDTHIIGLLFPGWENVRRVEGEVLPERGVEILPGNKVVSRAWIIAGEGETVVSSVQQFIKLRGLSPLPNPGFTLDGYVKLAGHGWLNSKIRENNLYRHAYWPGSGFNPMPAADAAFYQDWLTEFAHDTLFRELSAALKEAINAVRPESYYHSGIGHIKVPTAPLVYGNLNPAVKIASQIAKQNLSRFNQNGVVVYRPSGVDYAKTHYTNHANGLTAQVISTALDAAVFSGDGELIKLAIERLRGLEIYKNEVPRGAQTWEVPLHTPDILASAHLVHAYTLGYKLTGEKIFLERAQYWAYTGVPFVYLVSPTKGLVGPYSTIAVLGATSWKAPVWMGLPVQWCGLVYSDALYTLAEVDDNPIWRQIADGITAAGIQHTYETNDVEHGGLLPDSYDLKAQRRNGPAINPGTLQVNAIRYYKKPPIYDCKVSPVSKFIINAPGNITLRQSKANVTGFTVEPWSSKPYYILVNNVPTNVVVEVNGKKVKVGDGIPDESPRLAVMDRKIQINGKEVIALSGTGRISPSAKISRRNLVINVMNKADVEIRTK